MSSRPKISWSDLRAGAVGVWGLGLEGSAALRRLRQEGVTAPVLVDDHPAALVMDGLPVLATDRGGLEALARCEVVVKTPGISRYRPDVAGLQTEGVAVVGGLGLWMEGADLGRVLCVTGTKGKSTTAAVAGHLLTRLGYRCLVAGNIGRPPYDPELGDDYDLWVVEVSSFQAADLASSPPVVAVTSLHADHLDWHGDEETYFADKLSLCTLPGARVTVADGSSDPLVSHRRLLGPEVRWVHLGDPELDGPWVDGLGLLGAHNRRNALIARACLAAMGVAAAAPGGEDALAEAAQGFTGLASRLQHAGTVAGVDFVDDSLSTNVLATLAALDTFPRRRLALVVGGHDRGIDYRPLAEALARRDAPTLVLTLPANGPRIGATLASVAAAHATQVRDCPDLVTATRGGFEWAKPDGVVLLSPAAPSFGQFSDFADRSAAFRAAARSCAGSD
ncbi:MAG TPA: UDP-N-acetylmuramoyl-L-alanine--D-glutamate ligase [Acidimicrobiales bacterium]|nr:UDP-N-acetylmuramoyl-L-alanine--D-glutamate ligase [Acidimicrobiales bacterium]